MTRLMPVDHLSPSSLRRWQKCPEQWRRYYVLGEKNFPPSAQQHLGKSFHSSVEANHRQKIETRTDLPLDELQDRFVEAFNELPRNEVLWEDEKPDDMKDDGTKIVKVYAKQIAPTVQPILVEHSVDTPIDSFDDPDDLELPPMRTILDVVEDTGAIVDFKTTGKKPGEGTAASSDQLTAYANARRHETGEMPPSVRLEVLIRPSAKFQFGRHETVYGLRAPHQIEIWLRNVKAIASQMQHALRTGLFPYADSESWACAASQCAFFNSCPGGRARRTSFAPAQEGDINGRTG